MIAVKQTKPTLFTMKCRVADRDVTLHGVRLIEFTEHRSLTSISKCYTIAFFHDDVLFEVFGFECLGKALEISSFSWENKTLDNMENRWTICSTCVHEDPADKSRLLIEISLESQVFGYFPRQMQD